jgi:hypothetical protein
MVDRDAAAQVLMGAAWMSLVALTGSIEEGIMGTLLWVDERAKADAMPNPMRYPKNNS